MKFGLVAIGELECLRSEMCDSSSSYICESLDGITKILGQELYHGLQFNKAINFRGYILNGYPYQNDVLERHANDVAMEV